jgi:hypothetical protein
MNARPWDKCIADTMLMWSSDREKRVGMDKLCLALGMDGKGDFDGSMVAATWPIDPQKVADYCKADVERTRALYRRMSFDPQGKADAGMGQEQSSRPEAASPPPIQFDHLADAGKAIDAALITEFLALQSCSPAAKKEMRATVEKWEMYRCKTMAARALAAAA